MKDGAPDYPPTQLVIEVPLDGEPSVVADGGMAAYLVDAVLNRLLEASETEWELTPAEGSSDDED